ncbi:hypothetical protein [Profundibacter amoris]|uniref:Uncharacterized protein n=1 Tax=Profundibacter amoris TaxID=2171755 RepID=A0A347UEG4_9RHOB|nr:hypothetical protein [Profundibacter amoris]AXX97242.1 hypothetical protein BAR1_04415 [Profundibacter amoris]
MEKMLIQTMAISLDTRPEFFSIVEGDICFLGKRIPDWLCLALAGNFQEFLANYETSDKEAAA